MFQSCDMYSLPWDDILVRLKAAKCKVVSSDTEIDNLYEINAREKAARSTGQERVAQMLCIMPDYLHRYAMQCPYCNQYCSLQDIGTEHDVAAGAVTTCCICLQESGADTFQSFSMTSCCMKKSQQTCICDGCMQSWFKKDALLVKESHSKISEFTEVLGSDYLGVHGKLQFLFRRVQNTSMCKYLNWMKWNMEPGAAEMENHCRSCNACFKGPNSILEVQWHKDSALKIKYAAMAYLKSSKKRITRSKFDDHINSKMRMWNETTEFTFTDADRKFGIAMARADATVYFFWPF